MGIQCIYSGYTFRTIIRKYTGWTSLLVVLYGGIIRIWWKKWKLSVLLHAHWNVVSNSSLLARQIRQSVPRLFTTVSLHLLYVVPLLGAALCRQPLSSFDPDDSLWRVIGERLNRWLAWFIVLMDEYTVCCHLGRLGTDLSHTMTMYIVIHRACRAMIIFTTHTR